VIDGATAIRRSRATDLVIGIDGFELSENRLTPSRNRLV
jgi:hypothetical protein